MRLQTEIKEWFPWPDDPDGAEVLIRHLRSGEIENIMDRTREITVRDGETVIRMNGTHEAAIVAAISDWKKFYGDDGKELPCTPGNIRKKCREDGFMPQIDAFRIDLAARNKVDPGADQKN